MIPEQQLRHALQERGPLRDALREQCDRKRVVLYINSRAQRNGKPPIELRYVAHGMVLGLGEFRNDREALAWLNPGVYE